MRIATPKTALITGASSGIGRDIAEILSSRGYRVIISARRENRLVELSEKIGAYRIVTADLSDEEDCFKLYDNVKDENISVVVNCAGFGAFGEFSDADLENDLDMINVNIKAVHILTKLFLKDFKQRNRGYILNVASSAGLMPSGPYMATYYATKAYVTSLTAAIAQELKEADSRVYVGALCPGPVDTEFNNVAGVKFGLRSISSKECAEYAVKKMFERKTVIVPTVLMKASVSAQRLLPREVTSKITGELQKRKRR